jgi:hypothetical protein
MRAPPYSEKASELAQVVAGDVTYTAFFKGGVWAYDSRTDESFVVFYPHDVYSWPTTLHQAGDWLLIGTRGEGSMLVNLRTWWLKRLDHVAAVDRFEVHGDKALVNDTVEIALPAGVGALEAAAGSPL